MTCSETLKAQINCQTRDHESSYLFYCLTMRVSICFEEEFQEFSQSTSIEVFPYLDRYQYRLALIDNGSPGALMVTDDSSYQSVIDIKL
uniref:Uncharacterized protein n=1 Tax=Romanomermis culicivorax TaxID=13658 RepID=A0A915ISG1_ROMCU